MNTPSRRGDGAPRRAGAGRLLAMVLALVALSAPARAQESGRAPSRLQIANEYIRIVLNNSPDATGRFSVDTTGGNPERADDDNRPLIYGGEEPWTSFTTVRLDGVPYVFGGPTHLPAGKEGPFGQLVTAPRLIQGGQGAEAAWSFPGNVEVVQRLSIARGRTTGLPDTVRIEYVAINGDQRAHSVGFRIVLDAMAGSNDGAPFRVGERAVERDTMLARAQQEMPEFWQVFDSLARPAVIAQGTLRGGEVTPPDRVYFTNWGVLRDSLWEFDFSPGRTFERKGEYELDSAVALFFEPQELGPGESRSVVVYYGLGGISIAPGQLAVGLSSPEMAVIGQLDPITILAYVQNTGQGAARETTVALQLPQGLELMPGESAVRQLGEVPPGQTGQVIWAVRVSATSPTQLTFSARAEAANAEPNEARRTLRVVSPARLWVQLRGPARLDVVDGRWSPDPFEVTGVVRNDGGVEAYQVSAQLLTPYGLRVAPGDGDRRYVGTLRPAEQLELRWLVTPTGASGNIPYSLKVSYAGAGEQPVPTNTVIVPARDAAILVVPGAGWPASGQLSPGQPFNVEVRGRNLPRFATARLQVAFDPRVVRLAAGSLAVDRGTLFVAAPSPAGAAGAAGARAAPSFRAEADDGAGRVSVEASAPATQPESGSLVVLRMVAAGSGSGSVQLVWAELRDPAGQVVYRIGPEGTSRPQMSLTVQPPPATAAPSSGGS